MKIGKNTLDLLKNFSGINNAIIVKPGNEISTVSIHKTVVAFATVPEEFPVQFGIYDLNNFIATVNLFDDPEIEFHATHMTITGGASKCSYGYADEQVVMSPKNRVKFPDSDVDFELTKDTFDRFMKASSTLGLPMMSITKDEKSNILIKAVDPKNPNANAFSVTVGQDLSDNQYNFLVATDNLKMVRGDYKVSISRHNVCRFAATDIEYFVSLEKSSTFVKGE